MTKITLDELKKGEDSSNLSTFQPNIQERWIYSVGSYDDDGEN